MTLVIFGGTGNLMETKLTPALLDLYAGGLLPERFRVIGLSRKELTDEEYRQYLHEHITKKGHAHSDEMVSSFCEHFQYLSGDFTDAEAYDRMKETIQTYDDAIGQCTNKLFYLAVPPPHYSTIFTQLHNSKVMTLCDGQDSWARLLVEKPFGKDLETAQALEDQLCAQFEEDQIYRIDHYLAKDAIENIISLRFSNSVLDASWSGQHIESICIRLLEKNDVATRGAFYDGIGALRDVGQNHLLQTFALLTMENVDVHDAHAVRAARTAALQALLHSTREYVQRGQYAGYVDTKGVDPRSQTETYFKVGLTLQSPQWKDTSVIFEAGKALREEVAEAVVTFGSDDKCRCAAKEGEHTHQNTLTITFAPQQQIRLTVWVKKPGLRFALEERELVLYKSAGEGVRTPEAYEQVLYDCIAGDQSRFVSSKEVELEWEFVTPILEAFAQLPLHPYVPGSTGPEIESTQ